MAAAVDRFEFLVKEISAHLSSGRDTLAIIGALYAVKKAIDLTLYSVDFFTACIAKQLGVYRDLNRRFGPWAGKLSACTCIFPRNAKLRPRSTAICAFQEIMMYLLW